MDIKSILWNNQEIGKNSNVEWVPYNNEYTLYKDDVEFYFKLRNKYLLPLGYGMTHPEVDGEINSFRLVNDFIRDKDLVIYDIGANKGTWTKLGISVLSNRNIKIHCFEPCKETFEILVSHFKNNTNVICNNLGISNSQERKVIYIHADFSECYSLSPMWDVNEDSPTEICNFTTVGNYNKECGVNKIDLLKLDIASSSFSADKYISVTRGNHTQTLNLYIIKSIFQC